MAAEKTTKKTTKKASKKTTKKASKKGKTVKLKLVRSLIGTSDRQRKVVQGLGLRRLQHTVERQDTPEIRGMIAKVLHLLEVNEG